MKKIKFSFEQINAASHLLHLAGFGVAVCQIKINQLNIK